MRRILDLLFWAVIAAAFIGPGTITTAARAGSDFGFALAWAILFSTLACVVLQEASARITVITGKELGDAIRIRFADTKWNTWAPGLVAMGIVLGCAAYEAGNLLGGVAGLGLILDTPPPLLTLLTGAAAAVLLAIGNTKWIARMLGALVAFMGVAFLVTAVRLAPDMAALLSGLFIPRIPQGSTLLVLGLVGTTVVPYNLFLGSALARGSRLGEMRLGLALAIGGGGLISLGVLVVGSALGGGLEYHRLAAVLAEKLGRGTETSLALGLFAAGFTSAITAPLAAAITARTLLGGTSRRDWSENSLRYRLVWLSVLVIGVFFGMIGVKPIPMIILAQAFNGLLLPLIAIFLWVAMNDRMLFGEEGTNTTAQNVVMGAVVLACVILGLRGLLAAATAFMAFL
ncbi:MAG: Nramp family divalent metal transporter, partial [Thermoanaerobaculales bacterium]|nr:Nramp family divalent metal transporter [Thermoanaerobaculales bacterium]